MVQSAKIILFGAPCGNDIENYLKVKGKHSKNTENSYRGDFGRFLREVFHTTIEDVTVEQLNSIDYSLIMQYRDNMDQEVTNNTINRHMSTISAIMKHLKNRNVLVSDVSYLDEVKKLPAQPVEIAYMPPEIVDIYTLEAGKEKNHPELKQSLIMIAVECALRLNEALNLEIGQFTIEGDTVVLKGYGKGNKEYFDRINIDVYKEVVSTMVSNPDNPKSKLFSPLSTKNITDMMLRIKNKLGYQHTEYSFHSFKKTGVTMAYEASGNDILEAQRKGRHSSLDTTRRYLRGRDYGATGLYSLRKQDENLYMKVDYEELLEGLEEMDKGFLLLLNAKLNRKKQKQKEK